jgi:hypothetical protein
MLSDSPMHPRDNLLPQLLFLRIAAYSLFRDDIGSRKLRGFVFDPYTYNRSIQYPRVRQKYSFKLGRCDCT